MFLSGGLDSSAVAALMTKIRRAPVETFSVGYSEHAYSELPYARTVAKHLNSIHHEVSVSREDFFSALPNLIWHEDEPITWPSSVALYFVARLARERVKVVLTGEGSDETLGGLYPLRLHVAEMRHLIAFIEGYFREACAVRFANQSGTLVCWVLASGENFRNLFRLWMETPGHLFILIISFRLSTGRTAGSA